MKKFILNNIKIIEFKISRNFNRETKSYKLWSKSRDKRQTRNYEKYCNWKYSDRKKFWRYNKY